MANSTVVQSKLEQLKSTAGLLKEIYESTSPTIASDNDDLFCIWSQTCMAVNSLNRLSATFDSNPTIANHVLSDD